MYNLTESVKGGTVCFSKAGLAAGSNAAKVKMAAPNGAATDYAIKGYMYTKLDSAGDDLFVFSQVQAAGTTCLYTMCLNASGTASVVKGTEVSTDGLTAGTVYLKWPEPTANTCPVGGVKIVATAVFTGGTTELGTGNTPSYYDFFAMPIAAPNASAPY